YEAAVFQWVWLEQSIERGALAHGTDQFNSLQEKLLLAFGALAPHIGGTMHFASVRGSEEDRATVDYLADLAFQSGIRPVHVAVEDIGRTAEGRFTDAENRLIETIFKLYPWEMLFADEFASSLSSSRATWREPLCSREGANVEIVTSTGERVASQGPYTDFPYIRQAFHALPRFAGRYALVGSWIVGDLAAGLGMREDDSLITRDT